MKTGVKRADKVIQENESYNFCQLMAESISAYVVTTKVVYQNVPSAPSRIKTVLSN